MIEELDLEWLRNNYIKREASIAMRDGVRLYTAIYVPRDYTRAHPILLERTNYGAGRVGPEHEEWVTMTCRQPFLRARYIIVFQDVRGRNNSQGEFEHIRPICKHVTDRDVDETTDAYDTVDWLVRNTCNNGRVGVIGMSYPGFFATMAMLSGHPAIKAVSPQAPVTDWYRGDDVHHNGAFMLQGTLPFIFWSQYAGDGKDHSMQDPGQVFHGDAYGSALSMGALKHYTEMMGPDVKIWNEICRHPHCDEWWEERNPKYHFHNIKPAVLVVGGLFDSEDCYGALEVYRAIRERSPETELYQVMGPWHHGAWLYSDYQQLGGLHYGYEGTNQYFVNEIEYPFFAYYLEGKGEKPVHSRVFHTGENKWMSYSQGWTPQRRVPFYLHDDFSLSQESQPQGRLVQYDSDPTSPVPYSASTTGVIPPAFMTEDQRFLWGRADVVDFCSEPLTEPLRVSGPVEVDFMVSISTTDADIVVKLIDIFPDDAGDMAGYQMLIRGDVMRGRYRNSLSNPEPFTPGMPTAVRFTLNDVAHTWLPGHRLMVQIQSSWFPLVDMNPQQFVDIYNCDNQDFVRSTITLHAPSRIWLPLF